MSEIVYEETSKGVMQPKPSPYQRRKQREEARLQDERRQDRLTLWVYIPLAVLAFLAWVLFNALIGYLMRG